MRRRGELVAERELQRGERRRVGEEGGNSYGGFMLTYMYNCAFH